MKKIIPFKKEIIFNDNLSEITSISLEHNLKSENNEIVGNFYITGEYKVTRSSQDTLKFDYDLPFEIDLDERYILDNATIDVDDFYYEIINEQILKVNIEVLVDNIEEKEIVIEEPSIEDSNDEDMMIEESVHPKNKEVTLEYLCKGEEMNRNEESTMKQEKNVDNSRCIEDELPSIFDNLDSSETYRSYTIYIVRENDTIESILTKYNISKEALEDYNDMKEIKIGDKIIIPNA